MTVYTVYLFNQASRQNEMPKWWLNFVFGNDLAEASLDEVNEALLDYHASFSYQVRGSRRYIDFYDDQAYSWFVLRWS